MQLSDDTESLTCVAYPPSTIGAYTCRLEWCDIGPRWSATSVASLGATQILEKNQPDTGLPEPLFSPLAPSQKNSLPDEAYLKAQAEYEAWLSRKAEREGDMGDGAFGTRDWVPRERVVARPGGAVLEQRGARSRSCTTKLQRDHPSRRQ